MASAFCGEYVDHFANLITIFEKPLSFAHQINLNIMRKWRKVFPDELYCHFKSPVFNAINKTLDKISLHRHFHLSMFPCLSTLGKIGAETKFAFPKLKMFPNNIRNTDQIHCIFLKNTKDLLKANDDTHLDITIVNRVRTLQKYCKFHLRLLSDKFQNNPFQCERGITNLMFFNTNFFLTVVHGF